MWHFVESFGKVQDYSMNSVSLVSGMGNVMMGTAQLSFTGKTMSKAMLFIVKNIVQFLIHVVQNNVLREFTGSTF